MEVVELIHAKKVWGSERVRSDGEVDRRMRVC